MPAPPLVLLLVPLGLLVLLGLSVPLPAALGEMVGERAGGAAPVPQLLPAAHKGLGQQALQRRVARGGGRHQELHPTGEEGQWEGHAGM